MILNERASLPWWQKLILVLFSLLATAIQVFLWSTLYGFLFGIQWTYSPIIFFITEILGMSFAIYIISKPIPSEYKLTWCVLILVLPLPFITLYIINSLSKLRAKKKQKRLAEFIKSQAPPDWSDALKDSDAIGHNLVKTVQSSVYAPVYGNSRFTFFNDATLKNADMLEEMKKAERYIFIEYFIISEGKLLDKIIPVLRECGERGVKIHILYDDLGSKPKRMTIGLIKKLLSVKNCELNAYQPVTLHPLVNNRDHRKIVVIDGRIAYCGGDNLSDEYIHERVKFGFWRDNCGKYEGECVKTFAIAFAENWYISCGKRLDFGFNEYSSSAEKGFIAPFTDGPFAHGTPTYDLFLALINSASEELLISTPYFVVDDGIRRALAIKARSGVKVKILMPAIPDKKAVFYAGRSNYGEILKAGGEFYEFTPGFNHAKTVIADGKYAYIGTSNFDYRSLFLHYECGALVINDPEISKMKEDFYSALSLSEKMDYAQWKKRPFYQKAIAYLLKLFTPLF